MRVEGVARAAHDDYRGYYTILAEAAKVLKASDKPLHARRMAQRANLALRAARAEVFDPETVVGPECSCEGCERYRFSVRFDQLTRGQF